MTTSLDIDTLIPDIPTQEIWDRMLDFREQVYCDECNALIHHSAAEIIMWYREPVLIRCHPCAEKRWSDMMEERGAVRHSER